MLKLNRDKTWWESYITQFEVVAGMSQWNNEQKGNYLAMRLRGPALTLLGNLSPNTPQDFKELVVALESRFVSAHSVRTSLL